MTGENQGSGRTQLPGQREGLYVGVGVHRFDIIEPRFGRGIYEKRETTNLTVTVAPKDSWQLR